MNIIVCIKQIIDPEAPVSAFRVDSATNTLVPAAGISQVISPIDEQALEMALRLKEAHGGKVTALCLGSSLARDVVKKALSMGADELILIEDAALVKDIDSYATAHVLAAAIRKIGEFDLVLCGRQAADYSAAQVGSGIAEILGLPCITLGRRVEVMDGKIRVQKLVTDGAEVIETPLPALITTSDLADAPRYPTLKGIMSAARKQPVVWTSQDLGLDPAQVARRNKLTKLYIPVIESQCEFIEADSPAEAAVQLAHALREAKLI